MDFSKILPGGMWFFWPDHGHLIGLFSSACEDVLGHPVSWEKGVSPVALSFKRMLVLW